MANTLSKQEAYAAMYAFLEAIYDRTESDELGALLGGMSLLEDCETADPAAWHDWESAIRKVREGKANLGPSIRDQDS